MRLMRRLLLILGVLCLAACAQQTNSNAFDAVTLFRLGSKTGETLPAAQNNEVVVLYGGWSLNELMQTDVGKKYVQFVQEDSSNESWANEKLAPGIYHVKKGQPVPAVILASTLLAYQLEKGEMHFYSDKSPLARMVDDTHCENGPSAGYIGLYWSEGKLVIDKSYCSVLGGGVWEATR